MPVESENGFDGGTMLRRVNQCKLINWTGTRTATTAFESLIAAHISSGKQRRRNGNGLFLKEGNGSPASW